MSPLAVRRYRAERLLQAEFRQLQGRVVGIVARRVGATGGGLDETDLEACYALAWQGLYAVVLEGREVDNPTGWLILATYRRAIDEQRARRRAERGPPGESSQEPDLAGRLDDRDRLRELFEGLRVRLGVQERQAAVLCYLHGLTRSEAAARMGISERRMRRLMEGRPGRPGVSQKLGELAASIDEGRWCEQQGSLMRGLAFGILDRDGERYRLAVAHSSNCPACRSYVASLRGLASVLPPVFVPGGIGAAVLSRAGEGAGAAAAHSGAAGSTAGALGGAAGAGAGGAGGGWILASGPLGAKLAAGCLLALGVGAGCVGIGGVVLHDDGHATPLTTAAHAQAAVRAAGPSAGDDSIPAAATVAAGSPTAGSGAGRRRELDRCRERRGTRAGRPRVRSRAGARGRIRGVPLGRRLLAAGQRRLDGLYPCHRRGQLARRRRSRSRSRRRGNAVGNLHGSAGAERRSPAHPGGPRVLSRVAPGASQGAGKTFARRASASGLPRGRRRRLTSALRGSSRWPTMSAKSW